MLFILSWGMIAQVHEFVKNHPGVHLESIMRFTVCKLYLNKQHILTTKYG